MDLNVSRDGEAGGMGEGEQLTLSLKLPAVVTTFQFEYTAQGFLAFYTVPLFFFFFVVMVVVFWGLFICFLREILCILSY